MNHKQHLHTSAAPQAIGPYSQAVRVGQWIYLSGQIPLDPATSELVKGDFTTQVRRVFDNLQAVARAGGGELSDTVKLTIYLTDLMQFTTVNQVMTEYFTAPYPARATIGVASLPKGAPIEIEAVLMLSA